MADRILPDQATAENLQFILSVLYKAAQDEQKHKLDSQTATAIWDWATMNFRDTEVEIIQADPEPLQKLIVEVLVKVNKQESITIASESEKLRNYQEELEKENREKKVEAEAKLTKLDKHPHTTEVMQRIRRSIDTADPQSTATQILEVQPIEESVISDATLYPVSTTQDLTKFIQTTSTIPEASWVVTPMVQDMVVEIVPEIGAVAQSVANELNQATNQKLPPEAAPALAARILSYQINYPGAPLQPVLDQITLDLEAQGYPVASLEKVQEQVEKLDLSADLSQKIEAVLIADLQQTGMSPEMSKEIAKLVVFNKLPDIAYAAAQASPGKPNETRQQKDERLINTFTKINSHVIESLVPRSSPFLRNNVRFERVYRLMQSGPPPPPTFQESDYQTYDQQGRPQPNQVVNFFRSEIQGRVRDRAQSEAIQVAESWIKPGTTAATSDTAVVAGATGVAIASLPVWALPLGASVATAATVEWSLTQGFITYAGTNAAGQLTFALTETGRQFLLAHGATTFAGVSLTATGTAAGAEAGAAAGIAGLPGGIVGVAIAAVIGFIVTNLPKIWRWIKNITKKYIFPLIGGVVLLGAAVPLALLAGLGPLATFVTGIMSFGAGAMMGSQIPSLASGGVSGVLQPIGGFASHVFASLTELAVVEIATPIIIIIMAIPIVVALLLFIINSSAYVVPIGDTIGSGGGVGITLLPPGTTFDCEDTGNPVIAPGAVVQLLPDTNQVRLSHYCIVPTEIIIHWSGGWNGVQGTYNTLVTRDLACQFATDENTVLQMQQMWERKVEFPGCAYPHNDFSINIEMSGSCFSSMPGGSCANVNTPPPESELARTVDLVCWMKRQYNIHTIIGHFEIPNSGKIDPGRDFLYNTFLPRVNSQCP